MSQIITAVYEQGLLHPAVPLNFQEHERVRIHVLPEKPVDKTEQIIHFLVEIGMLTLPKKYAQMTAAPVSESERYRLSLTLGKATSKPLSEIIIEERGEW
jgi:predicted DNA-binding antitoxin AbrB/MazE fold protein